MSTPVLRAFLAKHESLILYAAKCCVGAAFVHGLSFVSGYIDTFWCLISLVLVLTPDSKEAVPLALSRMKANLCGVAAAVVGLAFGHTTLATLCLALALTALLCHLWNAMTGSRTAMAATIIIMWHPPGAHLWDAALSRLVAVFVGCLIGLVITLVFHRKLPGAPVVG
jgi:uncharacterized membrane protein YccC